MHEMLSYEETARLDIPLSEIVEKARVVSVGRSGYVIDRKQKSWRRNPYPINKRLNGPQENTIEKIFLYQLIYQLNPLAPYNANQSKMQF